MVKRSIAIRPTCEHDVKLSKGLGMLDDIIEIHYIEFVYENVMVLNEFLFK
jgi:hypothetical protein